jgi:hypothetical protein
MTTDTDRDVQSCPAVVLHQLLKVPHAALLSLWSSLAVPDLRELDGEYSGILPMAGMPGESVRQMVASYYQDGSELGYWLGKAFTPRDGQCGEGHNIFRMARPGRAGYIFARKGRYTTEVGPSLVDGRPAYLVRYPSLSKDGGGSGLVDEIRRYSKGLYLGTSTRLTPDGGRTSASECFLITGPVNPWTGADDRAVELPA